MSTKDGGPAFPIWQQDMNLGDTAGPGMSLRDYFAAQALAGLAAMSEANDRKIKAVMEKRDLSIPDAAAMVAYAFADAMLAERAKEPTP